MSSRPAPSNASTSAYARYRWQRALYDSPTAPRWVRDKGGALLHLAALGDGRFVASYATLGAKWGVGRRQAIRIAKRLREDGAVIRTHRYRRQDADAKPRPKGQTSNAWEITFPAHWFAEPEPDEAQHSDHARSAYRVAPPAAPSAAPPSGRARTPEHREILHLLEVHPSLQGLASEARALEFERWRRQHGKSLACVLKAIRDVAVKHGEKGAEQKRAILRSYIEHARPESDTAAVLAQLAELEELDAVHGSTTLAEQLVKSGANHGRGLADVLELVRQAAETLGPAKGRGAVAAHVLATVRGTPSAPATAVGPAAPGPRSGSAGDSFFLSLPLPGARTRGPPS